MICKKLFFLTSLIFFLKSTISVSQHKQEILLNKSLKELFSLYQKSTIHNDKIKYMETFVKVAKEKKIKKRILSGYQVLSSLSNKERKLLYYDSIINLSKNNPIKNYPSVAYNSKAIFYQNAGNTKKALDNYLLSNKFAKIYKNHQLINNNTFSIATLKRKIGEYNDALELYHLNLSFIKKNLKSNKNNYLFTLLAISNIYYDKKEIDSAKFYNKLGAKESLKYKNIEKYHHFSVNQGITHFLEKKHDLALDSLFKHANFYEKRKDTMVLSFIYLYLGKTFQSKNNDKNAFTYYKKIDSIFNPKADYAKEFREPYEYFINYYKRKKDLNNQLLYINKLIDFDSITSSKEKYISRKIYKEYDIDKLEGEKKLIEKELGNKLAMFKDVLVFLSAFFILILILLYIQNKRRKKYKNKFKEIISNKDQKNKTKPSEVNPNIPEDIITGILIKLSNFENNKDFLAKDITQSLLAKELETNTDYLSKIINHYKKTTFSNYLNNLRIEYFLEEVKNESILKKYTIKAIAEECGFNNSESFSKAFLKLKGIKPSYFLKELEKTEKKK